MTGTAIDRYAPIYKALAQGGIGPGEVDAADISVVAVLCGVGSTPETSEEAWQETAHDLARQRVEAARRGEQVTWDDIDQVAGT